MDDPNPDNKPWLPGMGEMYDNEHGRCCISTWDRGDRISASLINAGMTAGFSGEIPIFSWGLGGIVLKPSSNSLLCSHACKRSSRLKPLYTCDRSAPQC